MLGEREWGAVIQERGMGKGKRGTRKRGGGYWIEDEGEVRRVKWGRGRGMEEEEEGGGKCKGEASKW